MYWIRLALILLSGLLTGLSNVLAEDAGFLSVESWGKVGLESRIYPSDPLYPLQNNNENSVFFEPTLYIESQSGASFSLKSFVQFDPSDTHRSRIEIKEAYWHNFGYVGDTEWDLRIGINEVFWGTVETNNPVNIVNQTDLLRYPDGKQKLGQAMLQGTLTNSWGSIDVYLLPFHRPRIFPSQKGRLRTAFPVASDDNSIEYEHARGDRHIDFATRYNQSVDLLDFALSYFSGTSREPLLIPSGNQTLRQHYNQIRQIGLELQYTYDALLAKAEVINRTGVNTLGSKKSSYNASVLGAEYAFYGIFDSDTDATLIVEYNNDSREKHATSAFQNDYFLAMRFALNDVPDTNFTFSLSNDLDYDTQSLNFEFDRRLTDSITLELEAFKLLRVDERDVALWPIRDDNYLNFRLSYSY
ncbi:MAG: hypothetical protein OXC68_08050 [Aestuariivita sp.]|nr:hypothetical protein [Aestuariivita sp.]